MGPGGPGGFPFGGFEFGMGRGRGHGRGRQRRGDVRAAVLALLAERPMHGYEMIREISERSDGAWRPSPGSVYPLLQQLADEELVTEAEGSGSKRLFTLTDKGTEAAAEFTENPPWNQAAEDVPADEHEFRAAAKQLVVAMWQTPAAASAEQKARITTILNDTRRKIYAVLSEDATTEE
jgi:DNA-binding PadR family transcriptional regulator